MPSESKWFKMVAKLIIWSIWAAFGLKWSKMMQKLTIWSIKAARGLKWSKIIPKLSIWVLNDTLRRVAALNPLEGRETCFKRHLPKSFGFKRTPPIRNAKLTFNDTLRDRFQQSPQVRLKDKKASEGVV